MKLKQFFTDDDAVSPVIGVILMVAITVILAAVIASFVLGLGETTDTTPTASFDFDYDSSTATGSTFGTDGDLTISHQSGDTLDGDLVYVKDNDGNSAQPWSGSDISSGSSQTVTVGSGDTISVTWQDSSGDSSSTLGKWTGPDA